MNNTIDIDLENQEIKQASYTFTHHTDSHCVIRLRNNVLRCRGEGGGLVIRPHNICLEFITAPNVETAIISLSLPAADSIDVTSHGRLVINQILFKPLITMMTRKEEPSQQKRRQ